MGEDGLIELADQEADPELATNLRKDDERGS
jgi:hypothetical protein